MKRIGFLATGSELVNGEILNSNGQKIAQLLQTQGMIVGEHVVCDDQCANLEAALAFLLSRHDVVITTGGLGPTSDDCTKEIVAKLTGKAMQYDTSSWEHIVDRLSKRYKTIPESNKRQAYFPEGAMIYRNPNGTANACLVENANKMIFLLPGPPSECIPIFQESVLPALLQAGYASDFSLHRWRLMGISEAEIAENLDEIAKSFQLEFAYRAAMPYIDIKLWLSKQHPQYDACIQAVETAVAKHLITRLADPISQTLVQYLRKHPQSLALNIIDQATRGVLQEHLTLPGGLVHFCESPRSNGFPTLLLQGLESYWRPKPDVVTTDFVLTLHPLSGLEKQDMMTLPIRQETTLQYALELACAFIWEEILALPTPRS